MIVTRFDDMNYVTNELKDNHTINEFDHDFDVSSRIISVKELLKRKQKDIKF